MNTVDWQPNTFTSTHFPGKEQFPFAMKDAGHKNKYWFEFSQSVQLLIVREIGRNSTRPNRISLAIRQMQRSFRSINDSILVNKRVLSSLFCDLSDKTQSWTLL
jgi:hypothetical protein